MGDVDLKWLVVVRLWMALERWVEMEEASGFALSGQGDAKVAGSGAGEAEGLAVCPRRAFTGRPYRGGRGGGIRRRI